MCHPVRELSVRQPAQERQEPGVTAAVPQARDERRASTVLSRWLGRLGQHQSAKQEVLQET